MYMASQGSLFHVLESSTPFSYLHVWKTLELPPKSHAHGMPKNGLEYSRHFEQFDTLLGYTFGPFWWACNILPHLIWQSPRRSFSEFDNFVHKLSQGFLMLPASFAIRLPLPFYQVLLFPLFGIIRWARIVSTSLSNDVVMDVGDLVDLTRLGSYT